MNEYDELGRLVYESVTNVHNVVIASYTYELDTLGNRTRVTELSGKIYDYEYDELNRLTSETVTVDGISDTTVYTYDPTGNRLTKIAEGATTTYTYDANDRMTSDGILTYTYDNNGNTLSDGTRTYVFDSKNRIESFSDGINSVSYTYDTSNMRTSKTVDGDTTKYLLCKTCRYARVIEELDGSTGALEKSYTYGNNLLGMKLAGAPAYAYVPDGHGSIRMMTFDGNPIAEYDYNAYGELTNSSGWATDYNDFRYSGEQYDSDLDQYYLRARYYNQNVGRFSSMDTWGGRKRNPLSLNKYNYTEGNPVMNVDPSGNYLLELVTVTSMLMIMASCAEPSRGTASCGPCKGRKDSLGRDLFDSILEAAKDGERVTYSKFADDVKEFEYVTEIVIPIKEDTAKLFGKNACDAKCFAHEYPHTDENPVRIFNFDYGAAHKVVAYWHNHPDVWWYNGEKYNPLEISEPDKETARLIGGGTAYMTYKANEPPTNPENTVKERRLFWSVNDGDGTW